MSPRRLFPLVFSAVFLLPAISFAPLPTPSNCVSVLGASQPAEFVRETGLWGVSQAQLDQVRQLFLHHLGDQMIDLYVVGSRAVGRARGVLPVLQGADVDFLVHVRNAPLGARMTNLRRAISESGIFPCTVEIHTTSNDGNVPFQNMVTSFQHGVDENHPIIPQTADPAARNNGAAVRINLGR